MKTAIVTGASGNMGQAVVKKFIDEGYKVVGTVIPNDPVTLDPIAMGFPADKFEKIVVDLMNEDDSEKFVNEIVSKYGSVDVAVLTVGGFAMGSIAETKTSDINKQYELNFETAYNVARPVFVQMLTQKNGRIFIIGSKPGLSARYGKGMVAYGLAKSLIFRLAELMNDEAKGTNVVTSVVIPSTIDTPQNRKAMPDVDPSKWVKPEAIAGVIYFYCTQQAATLREPLIKVYNNA
ncbi:MAG TPA: SDR family NAD(P)-dependent oxidoreductase [Chitinophagaceae bacterium]|nr:SDR family NAD(P)-dependent oxidoreductase [Chitinophagaceae bacterium]